MEVFKNQRFREIIDYLCREGLVKNDSDFSDKIGKPRSQTSDCAKGKRAVTPALAAVVSRTFPMIDVRYLLQEDWKEMLLTEEQKEADVQKITEVLSRALGTAEEQKKSIESLMIMVQKQQEQIDRLLTLLEKSQSK